MNTTPHSTPCPAGTCKNYRYGHLLHWLHADVAVHRDRTWRRAVVSLVDGCEVVLSNPRSGQTAVAWHHASLADLLEVGQEVLVNDEIPTLLAGSAFINIDLTGRIGPVAVDELETLTVGYVIDMESGRGIAVGSR